MGCCHVCHRSVPLDHFVSVGIGGQIKDLVDRLSESEKTYLTRFSNLNTSGTNANICKRKTAISIFHGRNAM